MTKEQMRFQAAAMAMQGILASGGGARRETVNDVASAAIDLADALLSALYSTGKESLQVPATHTMIAGEVIRAGDNAEGIPTIEFETTREAIRDFPANLIGRRATVTTEHHSADATEKVPEADGWIEHRPGDAMPCDGGLRVAVRFGNMQENHDMTAAFWEDGASCWDSDRLPENEIIAWRPAK